MSAWWAMLPRPRARWQRRRVVATGECPRWRATRCRAAESGPAPRRSGRRAGMWCHPLCATALHVTVSHPTPQCLRARPGSTVVPERRPAFPRPTLRRARRPGHQPAAPASLSSSRAPRGDAGANDSVGEARLDVLAHAQLGGATNGTAIDGVRDDGETALQRCQWTDGVEGTLRQFQARADLAQLAVERATQAQLELVDTLCVLAQPDAGMRALQPFALGPQLGAGLLELAAHGIPEARGQLREPLQPAATIRHDQLGRSRGRPRAQVRRKAADRYFGP